ncbi:phytoene desaturase [Candidatus Poribacteria bacterium]|nr:phytoene desaturase [Candidatus Poribacteria bacterium]
MLNTAIVIGAGIGGLSTAARLARLGCRVTILEKNSIPGGRTGIIERDGHRFDTGPTLFLMPEIFAETYESLGENMEDHLDLIRIDPTYKVHFHDGTKLNITGDLKSMFDQLESIEPGSFEAFLRFTEEGYRNYHLSLKHFVGRNFRSWLEYLSPSNFPLVIRIKALAKHYNNTSKFFKDSRLRAGFSFQNMYLGLSPYDAMATYSLLQYTEAVQGVWYPRGGMYEVVETLTDIAQGLGVKFHYDSSVAKINVEGSKATGVTLENGEKVESDAIIANADLPYVYSELLPDKNKAKRLYRKKYSSSAIMFYWGIKGTRPEQLQHHNVFLADNNYRESFDKIFRDLTLPDDPSFYVCSPSRTDDSCAPPDGDSLLVLVPVGHINEETPQDWDAIRDKARNKVFAKLESIGIKNLEKYIAFEEIIEPTDYRDYLNLAKGSAFGLSHNLFQVGYLRPHNRHDRYKNLYFVGASTHPGGGLPMVLISARLVVERILKEQRVPEKSVSIPGKIIESER